MFANNSMGHMPRSRSDMMRDDPRARVDSDRLEGIQGNWSFGSVVGHGTRQNSHSSNSTVSDGANTNKDGPGKGEE